MNMTILNFILLLAGGGDGGGGNPLMTPHLGLFFWTVLIFVLFWLLMGKFAFKPIAMALKNREDSINDSLAAAEKAKEEMAALNAENERIMIEAREEKARILREAKEEGDRYISNAKEKASAEAKKLVDNATLEITNQKNAAIQEVKNQVGMLAVEMAEKVLGKELKDQKDQQNYVSDLISKIDLN